MQSIKNFFSQLISVDESRKSIVVLILIVVSAFGLYVARTTNDIPNNITTIILTLSGIIWGINTIKNIADIYTQKNNQTITNQPVENQTTQSNIDKNDSNPVV